jgi:hypothetical protein
MGSELRYPLAAMIVPGALLMLLATGCGAKTGLLVPERDAEPDADAEVPDCVDIDPEELEADFDIEISTQLLSADVFFLIDCTGSMREEIANIQRGLTGTIVPGAAAAIPDVRFGVGAFGDFAYGSYGNPTQGDLPFEMRRAITDDIGAVQAAIDELPWWDGNDLPESQVEALYQVATGEGLGSWIPPAPGCPTPGLGYPCFREGSQPVVMLVTDAEFHNGIGTGDDIPYSGITPTPRTFDQAMTALEALEVRVIGISSGAESVPDLEEAARRTGAVDREGEPLVYQIASTGTGLDETIVEGIESLARRVPLDVDAIVADVGGDDLDATVLVQEVIALRAEPPSGVSRIEGNTFYQAMPGTMLTFTLRIDVSVIPVPDHTTLYPVLVQVRGNRVNTLFEQVIYIEVPGRDGADLCVD